MADVHPLGRRARGRETEYIAAEFWRPLYPWAQPTGSSTPGVDILNTPGVKVEVKARRKFDPGVWLKQARGYSDVGGEVPVVMWRPDGSGPATVADWPVMTTARHIRALLADRQQLHAILGSEPPPPLQEAA